MTWSILPLNRDPPQVTVERVPFMSEIYCSVPVSPLLPFVILLSAEPESSRFQSA